MWWLWVLGGLVAWAVVAVVVGMVIGRGIHQADLRAAGAPLEPAAVLVTGARRARVARSRRRAIPLPPIGVALFAVAVALETVGYVGRLTAASGRAADLLSMDAPWSLPRLFIAALFAAAALAAVAGAGSIPGRRSWWLAVALVGGGIAAVKAGSTVHAGVLARLNDAVGVAAGLAISAFAAIAVVGALWFLSRAERRDRRRVLSALAMYAGASVGLSAVSAAASSSWAATATFVEESGEALAGVSFLIAVLVGVAPRVVLPAAWALRRSADAHSLELPEQLPGRSAEGHARG